VIKVRCVDHVTGERSERWMGTGSASHMTGERWTFGEVGRWGRVWTLTKKRAGHGTGTMPERILTITECVNSSLTMCGELSKRSPSVR
jgi:hypothetical protein